MMLTATINQTTNEIETTGAVEVGDIYNGFCCAEYDWQVIDTLISVWGVCQNPACLTGDGPDDPYLGMSHVLEGDLAKWLATRTAEAIG